MEVKINTKDDLIYLLNLEYGDLFFMTINIGYIKGLVNFLTLGVFV